MLPLRVLGCLLPQVLGTVKDAALVMVSVTLLQEPVTQLQLWGYSLSLSGFCAYNVVKTLQHRPKAGGADAETNGGQPPSEQAHKLA